MFTLYIYLYIINIFFSCQYFLTILFSILEDIYCKLIISTIKILLAKILFYFFYFLTKTFSSNTIELYITAATMANMITPVMTKSSWNTCPP